jgi:hypothetical protein
MAARKAAEQKVDALAYFGDADTGLVGVFSHPNIPVISAAATGNENGGTNATQWSKKTPDQIIADVATLWNSIRTTTKESEAPNTLALPTDQYSYLATTPRSANTDTTILAFLKENLEGCQAIISTGRCTGAVNGHDVALAYDRSPETAELHIPEEFKQLPPELKGLEWIVNCYLAFAGLVVYRPMAFAIMEGI